MGSRRIGIAISYVNIFLHAVIGFLYVPILLYYIGKNEYGLYQLIGSLIAYFSIMDFGLTTVVIRFYARYKALKDRIGMENILAVSLYGYAGIACFMAMAGALVYACFGDIFSNSMSAHEIKEAQQIFLLLLFNIIITLSTMVFRAVINAEERFLFLKGMETVQLVLQPVLVVMVLQQVPSAFSVALVQTALNVCLILTRIWYCFHTLHICIHFHYWNHDLFCDVRKLALSSFAVVLIDQIFWKTNQVVLGIIDGTAAVAVYSIASLIYMNYMALSTAISGVYLPHVTAMVARKASAEELSALFIQIGRWQYYLLALVATGFIIFGRQFIDLWAGEDFADAYWITLLIIIPFTIDLIQNIGLAILQAMNQYMFRAKVYMAVGITNLILAIWLGQLYGGIGCAFATGLCMFIGNGIVMNWYYAKKIGLSIGWFWKEIGKISIPVAMVLLVGYIGNQQLLSASTGIFIGKICVYILVYSIVFWMFAMDDGEKKRCRDIIKRIEI